MKITKRQLDRIIAEEYALVQKKKLVSKRKTNKLTSAKRKRMLEIKRQRNEILIEAQAKLVVQEMLEEGKFGDWLAGLGGILGKAGEAVQDEIGKVGAMADKTWKATKQAYQDAAKENQDKNKKAADDKAAQQAEEGAQAAFQKWMEELTALFLKGGYEKEEAKAKVAGLSAAWQAAAPTAG